MNKQIIIIPLISLVILIIILLTFTFPYLNKIKKNSNELVAIKKEIVLIKDENKGINNLRKTREEITPALKKIENSFINKEVPVDFIQYLENRAEESNVVIEISPVASNETGNDLWESSSFRLIIEGNYDNFMNFFQKIEASPFLLIAKDLSVRSVDLQVIANTSIKVFSKQE